MRHRLGSPPNVKGFQRTAQEPARRDGEREEQSGVGPAGRPKICRYDKGDRRQKRNASKRGQVGQKLREPARTGNEAAVTVLGAQQKQCPFVRPCQAAPVDDQADSGERQQRRGGNDETGAARWGHGVVYPFLRLRRLRTASRSMLEHRGPAV